ncbi:MAG: hypothetical protein ACI87V_001960, partial [Flavobacteriales bacterium]
MKLIKALILFSFLFLSCLAWSQTFVYSDERKWQPDMLLHVENGLVLPGD